MHHLLSPLKNKVLLSVDLEVTESPDINTVFSVTLSGLSNVGEIGS